MQKSDDPDLHYKDTCEVEEDKYEVRVRAPLPVGSKAVSKNP